MTTLELAHDRVVSDQPVRLIVLADQGGNVVEQALRAITPGLGLDPRAAYDAREPRPAPSGRARRQPGLVAEQSHRPIAEAVAQRPQGATEIERAAQRDAALHHRRIESRIGVGPDWAASSSARVRIPR